MEQLPRPWLRIALVEVREKGNIGECLEARRVVGHGVLLSWEILCHVAVAVESLMVTCESAQGGGSAMARHSSFPDTGDCWSVVGEVLEGGVG